MGSTIERNNKLLWIRNALGIFLCISCFKSLKASNPYPFEKDTEKRELLDEVRANISIVKQSKDKMYKDKMGEHRLFNNDEAKNKFLDKIDEISNENFNFNFKNYGTFET